jgi:predicted O-methyltransferase YrrM
LGIPKVCSGFTEEIFEKHAPGELPSYEQYYLNEELEERSISVCELPADINVLFSFPDFEVARLKHYTYHPRAKDFIELHREEYFSSDEALPIVYDTRMEMIKGLIGEKSSICEIGVFKGDMAKDLHRVLDPSSFVMIDLFEGYTGSGNQDGNMFEMVDLEKSYEHLEGYFKGVSGIEIKRGDSVKMLSNYQDESFDMIYIDADHSYEGCKRDLIESYKKVKKGGYIMGHDYEMNMKKAEQEYSFGVRRAVDTFCELYSLRICAKGMDGCVSYAIKKE